MRITPASHAKNRDAARDRYRAAHATRGCSPEIKNCDPKELPAPEYVARCKRLKRAEVLEYVERIAADYWTSLREVLGSSRMKRVSRARQAVWAGLRDLRQDGLPVFSYPDIGALFDRDHTTVSDGVAAHREREAKAPKMRIAEGAR